MLKIVIFKKASHECMSLGVLCQNPWGKNSKFSSYIEGDIGVY